MNAERKLQNEIRNLDDRTLLDSASLAMARVLNMRHSKRTDREETTYINLQALTQKLDAEIEARGL